jgi:putative ABC transport system permease protein
MRSISTPPRLTERVLSLVLGPGGSADGILGDLHEEYAHRARRPRPMSIARAQIWYCGEAAKLGWRYGSRRTAASFARPGSTPAPLPHPGDSIMSSLVLDLRYAVRTMVKRPSTSAIIVLTLALGLGANAAIFGVIDALVLHPFAFSSIDRLAVVAQTKNGDAGYIKETVSPANFLDWKKQAGSFERLAAFGWWDASLTSADDPERVSGFFVTADFFPVLGVQATLGRLFQPDDEIQGQHRRAVLSHALWQRRFGGDVSIIGRTIDIDGQPFEIIGVAPNGFDFPMGSAIWAPLSMTPKTATQRRERYLTVIGRLAPGHSLDDASAQMAVVAHRLEQEYPEANKDRGARVLPFVSGMQDVGLGSILMLWQASAAFVLLIACANIANLLLARGAERQRDLAVRLALGASRARLVRQMLSESTLLAFVSIPLAMLVASGSLHLIKVSMPARILRFVPGWNTMGVDGRLFFFTALLAIAAAVVFGVVPALQAAGPRVAEALKDGGRSATAGRQRFRRGLVVAEIALSLPLLVAAALSSVGANRFLNGPQGYDADGVLAMRAALPDERYEKPEPRRQFVDGVLQRLSALPGVQSAAATNVAPAGTGNSSRAIEIEGRPNPDQANPPLVDFRSTTAAYFETMRIPIRSGRAFTEADRAATENVAIVTEAAASRYFPGTDPIGKRLRLGDGPWLNIVGVAGDVVHDWFGRRSYPTVYRPYSQAPTGSVVFMTRTDGDPQSLVLAATHAVRAVDPVQPVFDVMSMRQMLHERTIGLQYVAAIMVVFGGLALVLAVVGVYSVMAFLITQRTQEIGVRIALGASRRDVFSLTMGQTGRLTAIGLAVGLVFSVFLGRFLEGMLVGAIPNDMRVQAALAAVLVAAAMLAGYIPARRAAGIDPIIALRNE